MTEPSGRARDLRRTVVGAWNDPGLPTIDERADSAAHLIDAALTDAKRQAWDEGLRAGFNMSAEGFNSEHRHFYGKWHHAANPYREHP